jgi:hypothetical protein
LTRTGNDQAIAAGKQTNRFKTGARPTSPRSGPQTHCCSALGFGKKGRLDSTCDKVVTRSTFCSDLIARRKIRI